MFTKNKLFSGTLACVILQVLFLAHLPVQVMPVHLSAEFLLPN